MVMLPCSGARPDEAVLDPYVYAGQHVGSSISGWLLSLSTLMLLGVCLARARNWASKTTLLQVIPTVAFQGIYSHIYFVAHHTIHVHQFTRETLSTFQSCMVAFCRPSILTFHLPFWHSIASLLTVFLAFYSGTYFLTFSIWHLF